MGGLEDFTVTADYLGPAPARPCPITFGRDGMPFYVCGPYDDTRSVVSSLEAAVGPGNYHHMVTVD